LLGADSNKRDGNFRSYIKYDNKNKFLGYFDTAIEAHNAYIEAKRKYHEFGML
jgi:hypothetical protein